MAAEGLAELQAPCRARDSTTLASAALISVQGTSQEASVQGTSQQAPAAQQTRTPGPRAQYGGSRRLQLLHSSCDSHEQGGLEAKVSNGGWKSPSGLDHKNQHLCQSPQGGSFPIPRPLDRAQSCHLSNSPTSPSEPSQVSQHLHQSPQGGSFGRSPGLLDRAQSCQLSDSPTSPWDNFRYSSPPSPCSASGWVDPNALPMDLSHLKERRHRHRQWGNSPLGRRHSLEVSRDQSPGVSHGQSPGVSRGESPGECCEVNTDTARLDKRALRQERSQRLMALLGEIQRNQKTM